MNEYEKMHRIDPNKILELITMIRATGWRSVNLRTAWAKSFLSTEKENSNGSKVSSLSCEVDYVSIGVLHTVT